MLHALQQPQNKASTVLIPGFKNLNSWVHEINIIIFCKTKKCVVKRWSSVSEIKTFQIQLFIALSLLPHLTFEQFTFGLQRTSCPKISETNLNHVTITKTVHENVGIFFMHVSMNHFSVTCHEPPRYLFTFHVG